jgi:aminopeptidase N
MEWWNDIWLNEGFAMFYMFKGIDFIHQNWTIYDFFLTDFFHDAVMMDERLSTHPLSPEADLVTDPDYIESLFDDISYNKGAVVLRMLEYAIGSQPYANGIKSYVSKYSYSNAKTEYLWQEIGNVAGDASYFNFLIIHILLIFYRLKIMGLSVSDYMNPWSNQSGLPVVSIQRTTDNKVQVSQQRFLANTSNTRDNNNYLWPIYLTYISSNGNNGSFMLTQESGVNDVSVDYEDWIKFNPDSIGYYITNYELRDWQMLTNLLQTDFTAISSADRANLIFDASVLARNNFITYDVFFDLILYMANEDSAEPWFAAASSLQNINENLVASNSGLYLRALIRQLSRSMYSSLGWQNIDGGIETIETRY